MKNACEGVRLIGGECPRIFFQTRLTEGLATPMSERGFDILFEDESLLAVVKPSGIATQAPPAFESLESRIRAYLAESGEPPGRIYLGIPHRLDRVVSGAMIFAKTRRAARQLARQFERRQVKKLYWACVERTVEPLTGTWTDFLCKVYGHPRTEVVDHTHSGGQEAVLHYRTLGFHQCGSWLEIELETGRTHQVRVQASSRGYPILGDTHYGSRIPFGEQFEDERLRGIALHARSLAFFHPDTREEISLEAPLGESWNALALPLSTGPMR